MFSGLWNVEAREWPRFPPSPAVIHESCEVIHELIHRDIHKLFGLGGMVGSGVGCLACNCHRRLIVILLYERHDMYHRLGSGGE